MASIASSIERADKSVRRFICAAAASVLLLSCRQFEYSPYVVPRSDGGDAWLADALGRIALTDGPERGFSFAVIADIQSAYDDLRDCVRRVNADTGIRFVFVAGDLTQYGLLREFEWVRDGLCRLKMPFLPVLGNHDALANGPEIFGRLFGRLDYSFVYRGTKFVVFNDNAWEFAAPVPDLVRLESELESPDSLRLIPVAHIPPWGDQLSPRVDSAMTEKFARHRTTLCVFAHTHHFRLQTEAGERRPFLVADNIADRNYAKVTLSEDSTFIVERIFF
jgi:3',5'-cyclic-AMP phosphodiesterase